MNDLITMHDIIPPEPQPEQATKPFAYYVYVYVPAEQRGEFFHDLDEACDDLTNCVCEVTELFDRPSPSTPARETAETSAYAEGRGDQFEDDCAVVRLLFDNMNDVDVMSDGRINTTRVRELLSHFDIPNEVECVGFQCGRPECDSLGCTADRINTAREQRIDEARAASRKE